MKITEGYAPEPEQSTLALIAHHPQAIYFGNAPGPAAAGRLARRSDPRLQNRDPLVCSARSMTPTRRREPSSRRMSPAMAGESLLAVRPEWAEGCRPPITRRRACAQSVIEKNVRLGYKTKRSGPASGDLVVGTRDWGAGDERGKRERDSDAHQDHSGFACLRRSP